MGDQRSVRGGKDSHQTASVVGALMSPQTLVILHDDNQGRACHVCVEVFMVAQLSGCVVYEYSP